MNTYTNDVLLVVNLICAAMVLFRGVFFIINQMTRDTFFPFRLAWIFISTGALAVLLGPIYGTHIVSWPLTLIYIGLALFTLCTRRKLMAGHP